MIVTRSQLKSIILESMQTHLKLRVLDFDDTIAHTGEMVRLYTPDGPRRLSSDEYAVYQTADGEYYDDSSFEEFSHVDSEKAKPVSTVFKILRNFVTAQEGNRIILILTARKQEVEEDVRFFLRKHGLDDSAIMFEGVGSSDPYAKVEVIKHYIDMYNAGFVSFFDDSIKNVRAVKTYLDASGIHNDVAHIKDVDGLTKLVRKFDITQ